MTSFPNLVKCCMFIHLEMISNVAYTNVHFRPINYYICCINYCFPLINYCLCRINYCFPLINYCLCCINYCFPLSIIVFAVSIIVFPIPIIVPVPHYLCGSQLPLSSTPDPSINSPTTTPNDYTTTYLITPRAPSASLSYYSRRSKPRPYSFTSMCSRRTCFASQLLYRRIITTLFLSFTAARCAFA